MEALKASIEGGLYSYGSPDDPGWSIDPIAFEYLVARTLDGITKRSVPTIKMTPVEGGWKVQVVDLAIGYQCTFPMTDLEDFFVEWRRARHISAYWTEIDYGEFAQARKAKRKKDKDDARNKS